MEEEWSKSEYADNVSLVVWYLPLRDCYDDRYETSYDEAEEEVSESHCDQ